MKPFILTVFLLFFQDQPAEIKVSKLNPADIPKSIHYAGHVINAVKYTDSEGAHIMVTTETGPTKAKNPDNDDDRDAALYAYNYLANGNDYTLTWQMQDFIKTCNLDMLVNYIPESFAVTDLNQDGKAEVWLMYKLACRGDVSPAEMKIIMHEGSKKFAMRGTNKVEVSPKSFTGGTYTFDEAFKSAPETFRQYAKTLWTKHLMEQWK